MGRLNTKDLEYFINLTQLKNFSKVAQKFGGVSQPTITFALQRLENELNAKLIIRHRAQRRLVITESGQQLLEHATDIMLHYQWLQREILAGHQKKLSLGLPPIIKIIIFHELRSV